MATYPSGDPDRNDPRSDRPTLSAAPAPGTRRSPWLAVAIAVVVVVVVGVIAYMLLYNGGTGGGGTGGSDGGGGFGYLTVAFTGDAIRRVVARLKR